MKNTSLKVQLLVSILFFIVLGIGTIFYISYHDLKDEIDSSKKELYEEKVDNIIYLIDQKYKQLEKTQMVEAYEKSFKQGTLKSIKEIFDKDQKDIYPFVINEEKVIVIHRIIDKLDPSSYQNGESYNKLLDMKNGSINVNDKNGNRWIVFKYYEPWDWIIGYRININEKYKELNEFKNSFLITTFLILLLISFLIMYIVRRILEPIVNLTDVTKEIASGNLEAKIEIKGTKELKTLASSFEKMRNHILLEMESLVKSEKEIESLNSNLQIKVEERTKELKEQKESFETLFNESKDGLCLVRDGKITDCNKSFLQILAYTRKEELIGLSPSDLSPKYQPNEKLSKDGVKDKIKECMENGSARFEWVHKKSDGTSFWTEIIITKIIQNNEVTIFATWRDISEKKELEEQLHNRNIDLQDSNDELETMIEYLKQTKNELQEKSEELKEKKENFEILFNESKDALSMFTLDDGKYIDCNDTSLEIFGLENKSEILGKYPFDFSPKMQNNGLTSIDAVKKRLDECIENGSVRFEWIHKKKDNTEFWADVILSLIVLNSRQVVYATVRDISDKKELEEQLHNRNIDLQDSNDELETMIENLKKTQNKLIESEKLAALGNMVAGVAHEINTPVGIGLTGSSHLEFITENIFDKYKNESMSEEEFEDYIKTSIELSKVINSNLNRTADIVKNFKQVAIDQTSEQKRIFNIKEYIKGILISIDSIKGEKDLDISINCDDNLEIVSYPGFFAQIITNLVSNSISHGFEDKQKGSINFDVNIEDNNLCFKYSDDGRGISKDNLPKIFDLFFSTNKQNGGSGLGMNIIYNLVTVNLHGTINCTSNENEGTTFYIVIPL